MGGDQSKEHREREEANKNRHKKNSEDRDQTEMGNSGGGKDSIEKTPSSEQAGGGDAEGVNDMKNEGTEDGDSGEGGGTGEGGKGRLGSEEQGGDKVEGQKEQGDAGGGETAKDTEVKDGEGEATADGEGAAGEEGKGHREGGAADGDTPPKAPILSEGGDTADISGRYDESGEDGDRPRVQAGGGSEGAAEQAGKPAGRIARDVLGLAIQSGLVGLKGIKALSATSVTACSLCREGRKFHVRVTAETPLYVWSSPTADDGEAAQVTLPDEVSDKMNTRGGLDVSTSEKPQEVAESGVQDEKGSPARGEKDIGKRMGISTVAVAAAKRAAETARRRSADFEERRQMRLKGSRVAPLRVWHITWDRPNEDLRDEFVRELPKELEKVTFGLGFNGPVEGVRVTWPAGMKSLHFGLAFNPRPAAATPSTPTGARVGAGTRGRSALRGGRGGGRGGKAATAEGGAWAAFLPEGLEELAFGGHFNQPLVRVRWPPALKRVVFGANFKQSVDCVDWPPGLEEITFGSYFNQPIEAAKWPASLKQIVFGTGFNQPVEKCRFPNGLERIAFGAHFNQPVESTRWPQRLKQLTFGEKFNKPVSGTTWPPELSHLTFGRLFDQTLDGPTWPPSGLKVLVVGSRFKGKEAAPGGEDDTRGFSVARKASPGATRRKSQRRAGGSGKKIAEMGASTSERISTDAARGRTGGGVVGRMSTSNGTTTAARIAAVRRGSTGSNSVREIFLGSPRSTGKMARDSTAEKPFGGSGTSAARRRGKSTEEKKCGDAAEKQSGDAAEKPSGDPTNTKSHDLIAADELKIKAAETEEPSGEAGEGSPESATPQTIGETSEQASKATVDQDATETPVKEGDAGDGEPQSADTVDDDEPDKPSAGEGGAVAIVLDILEKDPKDVVEEDPEEPVEQAPTDAVENDPEKPIEQDQGDCSQTAIAVGQDDQEVKLCGDHESKGVVESAEQGLAKTVEQEGAVDTKGQVEHGDEEVSVAEVDVVAGSDTSVGDDGEAGNVDDDDDSAPKM